MTPLPAQPSDVPWPTDDWPHGTPDPDVDHAEMAAALDSIFAKPVDLGVSLATVVVHRGRVIAERYGPETDADTTLISWSMAKSVTNAIIGLLVGDGRLDIDAPAAVPEFAGTNKAPITVRQLLAMMSGLQFVEDYVDDATSHCLDMLFGRGVDDHAHYAASLPLSHEPGTVWNYSSGTTNIVARIAGDLLGGREGIDEYMRTRLFDRIGMRTASPKYDTAGTFVGSSYVYANALDFARFGLLYLRDGVWDGERILPSGWVDYSRTVVATDPEPPHFGYGAHWWIWPNHSGSIAAHGYEGQYIVAVPDRDLVVVHLGKVPSDVRPPLLADLERVIAAVAPNA
jgi:CubicO group peptidase (beta-lactamase class C family)